MSTGLPVALAVTAGTVAAFNPCGFAMLPAYLTMLVAGGRAPLVRALLLAAAMTGGFVTVFGLFGLVVVPLAHSVGEYLPWVTMVIGAALVVLGGALLTGRELLIRLPGLGAGRPTASAASLYGYGLSYAVASLSCTAGPFLAVTSASLTESGLLGGLVVFVAYALGMGLVVAALSVAVALARAAAVAGMRRILPYVSRVSGGLLVLAGLYVAYYGWYELRVFAGASTDDPVVGAVTAVQGAVAGWVEDAGPGRIAAALAVLVLAGLAVRGARRKARRAREARREWRRGPHTTAEPPVHDTGPGHRS